jgi:hypothetical protein
MDYMRITLRFPRSMWGRPSDRWNPALNYYVATNKLVYSIEEVKMACTKPGPNFIQLSYMIPGEDEKRLYSAVSSLTANGIAKQNTGSLSFT